MGEGTGRIVGVSEAQVALNFLGSLDLSTAARFASLLLLPFAHEDLAILFGAYCIVNGLMPASLVAGGIYGGMVASDFALYGIGAGARHLPFLNRFAIDDHVRRFALSLKRNLFGLFALCRMVPGVVFVAFVACGWFRVPLSRFTVASLTISALYLPIMLYLVIVFGDAMDDHVGLWAWPFIFGVMVATSLVRRRVFAFGSVTDAGEATAEDGAGSLGHIGMPSLSLRDRRVALAERIPPVLFYLPLVFTWIGLGFRHRSLTLPTAANPTIPTGGMWGESKSACLADVGAAERRWVADFIVLRRKFGAWNAREDCDRALQMLTTAGIPFPIVAKPDVGWHGHGVCRLDNAAMLSAYLGRFPADCDLILQRLVPHAGEAAVVYARLPGEARGCIVSLAFRYFPHVVGDGQSSVLDLIQSDPRTRWKSRLHLGDDATHRGLNQRALERVPAWGEVVQIAFIGNQRAGGLYRDARRYVTAALEERIDDIARSMTEFHYGRFDIRFESTESLMRGEDLAVVEVNGIGGEAIDAWDPLLPVAEAYRRLIAQQRLLFRIGDRNRARGFKPTGAIDFLAHLVRQTQLIRRYPPSA